MSKKPTISASTSGTDASRLQGHTEREASARSSFSESRIVGPRVFKQQPDEAAIQKVIDTELPPLLAYLEGEIGDRDYLVDGRLSIADIAVATQLVNLQHAGVRPDATRTPNLARWLGSILARPSFKAVIEEERRTFGIA